MNLSKTFYFCFFILLCSLSYAQPGQPGTPKAQPTIKGNDLANLLGNWEGTLTYIDYTSNKPYTMPANLIVEQGKNENEFKLQQIYPNEPKANSKGKITISKDGSQIDKAKILSLEKNKDDSIEIVTQSKGKDDNKEAMIRLTYFLSSNTLTMKKEVRFENSSVWIKRNEYSYSR
ncbi:MAG: hypothetical protein N4A46_08325 [Schleiferiaceae bacterium]|jgi:hypothetical protein|nr:hypothetical protein [Schleiferiaceae bacterium]